MHLNEINLNQASLPLKLIKSSCFHSFESIFFLFSPTVEPTADVFPLCLKDSSLWQTNFTSSGRKMRRIHKYSMVQNLLARRYDVKNHHLTDIDGGLKAKVRRFPF